MYLMKVKQYKQNFHSTSLKPTRLNYLVVDQHFKLYNDPNPK